jgi:hypothetical protein
LDHIVIESLFTGFELYRAGMPSIFMSLSLNITAKYQITEMTFEWKYPVIPNMFARDTYPSGIELINRMHKSNI